MPNRPEVVGDLLYGARQIGRFLFGEDAPEDDARRRVYSMADAGAIPVFRLGGVLCSRRSSIAADLTEKERTARVAAARRRASKAAQPHSAE